MKSIALFVLFPLLFFLMGACNDSDSDQRREGIAPISNVTYESGYGEIFFKWQNPDYKDISYVEIFYEDLTGKVCRVLAERGVSEKLIEGFGDSKVYDFIFTVYGLEGASSLPVKVSVAAQPKEPNLNLFNTKIKIARKTKGVLVSWFNQYEGEYYINVTYKDVNNNEYSKEIVVTDPGEGEELIPIEGVMEAVLHISTSDTYGNTTASRIYNYKMMESGKLDRTIWSISASSNEVTQEQRPVANVLDGDISTFWHSEYGSGTQTFPHYIQVDMKRKVKINKIGLQHRQNKIMAKDVEFYGTNKLNGAFEKFGSFSMHQTNKTIQYVEFVNAVEYRFVKILFTTASSGDAKNAGLAELEIWGEDIDE
ncbi:MAG: discoidin domain-containing protein [Odoribacter sp.]